MAHLVRRLSIRVLCSLSLIVSGCASQPENVSVAAIDPALYNTMSCEQLTQQQYNTALEFNDLARRQTTNANADGMIVAGGAIIWPVLLAGLAVTTDYSAQISVARGKYDAAVKASRSKQCLALPPVDVAVAQSASAGCNSSGEAGGDAPQRAINVRKDGAWCGDTVHARGTTPYYKFVPVELPLQGQIDALPGDVTAGSVVSYRPNAGAAGTDHFTIVGFSNAATVKYLYTVNVTAP